MQHRFKPGQVWGYLTRDVEPHSTLTICKTEYDSPLGDVVHIAVNGLRIKNPRTPNYGETIGHLPITAEALARSVTTCIGLAEDLPDFEEGYQIWRQDHGGVFTSSVAHCVAFIENTLNQ